MCFTNLEVDDMIKVFSFSNSEVWSLPLQFITPVILLLFLSLLVLHARQVELTARTDFLWNQQVRMFVILWCSFDLAY